MHRIEKAFGLILLKKKHLMPKLNTEKTENNNKYKHRGCPGFRPCFTLGPRNVAMKYRIGDLFLHITGKEPRTLLNTEEIDEAVEKSTNKKLHIKTYTSSVVPSRGNVFKYSQKDEQLENIIDKYLA